MGLNVKMLRPIIDIVLIFMTTIKGSPPPPLNNKNKLKGSTKALGKNKKIKTICELLASEDCTTQAI